MFSFPRGFSSLMLLLAVACGGGKDKPAPAAAPCNALNSPAFPYLRGTEFPGTFDVVQQDGTARRVVLQRPCTQQYFFPERDVVLAQCPDGGVAAFRASTGTLLWDLVPAGSRFSDVVPAPSGEVFAVIAEAAAPASTTHVAVFRLVVDGGIAVVAQHDLGGTGQTVVYPQGLDDATFLLPWVTTDAQTGEAGRRWETLDVMTGQARVLVTLPPGTWNDGVHLDRQSETLVISHSPTPDHDPALAHTVAVNVRTGALLVDEAGVQVPVGFAWGQDAPVVVVDPLLQVRPWEPWKLTPPGAPLGTATSRFVTGRVFWDAVALQGLTSGGAGTEVFRLSTGQRTILVDRGALPADTWNQDTPGVLAPDATRVVLLRQLGHSDVGAGTQVILAREDGFIHRETAYGYGAGPYLGFRVEGDGTYSTVVWGLAEDGRDLVALCVLEAGASGPVSEPSVQPGWPERPWEG